MTTTTYSDGSAVVAAVALYAVADSAAVADCWTRITTTRWCHRWIERLKRKMREGAAAVVVVEKLARLRSALAGQVLEAMQRRMKC